MINGFWLLIIERERAQKGMERRGTSKKTTPFLTLCQTPEDHISKKAWVAFGGPLSLFSLARRPCYSISVVCTYAKVGTDRLHRQIPCYIEKRLFGRVYFQILAYLLSVFQHLNFVT